MQHYLYKQPRFVPPPHRRVRSATPAVVVVGGYYRRRARRQPPPFREVLQSVRTVLPRSKVKVGPRVFKRYSLNLLLPAVRQRQRRKPLSFAVVVPTVGFVRSRRHFRFILPPLFVSHRSNYYFSKTAGGKLSPPNHRRRRLRYKGTRSDWFLQTDHFIRRRLVNVLHRARTTLYDTHRTTVYIKPLVIHKRPHHYLSKFTAAPAGKYCPRPRRRRCKISYVIQFIRKRLVNVRHRAKLCPVPPGYRFRLLSLRKLVIRRHKPVIFTKTAAAATKRLPTRRRQRPIKFQYLVVFPRDRKLPLTRGKHRLPRRRYVIRFKKLTVLRRVRRSLVTKRHAQFYYPTRYRLTLPARPLPLLHSRLSALGHHFAFLPRRNLRRVKPLPPIHRWFRFGRNMILAFSVPIASTPRKRLIINIPRNRLVLNKTQQPELATPLLLGGNPARLIVELESSKGG